MSPALIIRTVPSSMDDGECHISLAQKIVHCGKLCILNVPTTTYNTETDPRGKWVVDSPLSTQRPSLPISVDEPARNWPQLGYEQ